MEEFDKVIGYDSVKLEVARICDVLKNTEKYKKLGVEVPNGLLLHGAPGVGKTLMASCFIKTCGRKVFTCRKNLPNGEFVKAIKECFENAKKETPSIVFLDDFDKFSDGGSRNSSEYVTIQSCIDDVKGHDIFVLATANDILGLPDSLLRAGRFDVVIEIKRPRGKDAEKIIKHYIDQKSFVGDINIRCLARLLNGNSCAELETVINQAGIYAGFENKEKISYDHIIKACIREIYEAPATIKNFDERDDEDVAYHEAGHAVIAELLEPESVTMISIGKYEGGVQGFTAYYRDEEYWHSVERMKNRIMCLLAGRCATEIKYGVIDTGCSLDIDRALDIIKRIVGEYGGCGFGSIDISGGLRMSQNTNFGQEIVIKNELHNYYQKVREMLVKNREFLDAVAVKLKEKKLLVEGDVKEIRESVKIVK